MHRRHFLAAALTGMLAHRLAWADSAGYPKKPLTVIVPSTPGGVVDFMARLMQPSLTDELGQSIIVENRPGGGGHLGAGVVAKAPADGYTLLCSAGSILVSGVYQNLPYDPMADLTPVARLTAGGFLVLVRAGSPYRSLSELIEHGRKHPGKLFYASSSVGNSTHIGAEMLSHMTGMQATHVPYKGNMQALTDLIGGRVDFMLDSRPSALPQVQAGELRILAVTSPQRAHDMPEIPTVAETVPGYEIEGWTGFFVRSGTPQPIIERLSQALAKGVREERVISGIASTQSVISFLGPQEATAYMRNDHARLSKVVRETGISSS